ncbi:MAG: ribonuclease E/G, partial [Magnetococcus sp. WYHC-3]
MSKRMLVDATHAEEVRVAIVQDTRLIDLDIETSTKEQIKGNVYLGIVTRVEPSLQAAFVDFNGGRQGFLSVSDLHPKLYPVDKNTPEPDPATESDQGNGDNGEDEADGDDELPAWSSRHTLRRRNVPIQQILKKGQTILVQVVKEARGTKGASLTTHISLAGRYTVLLPENRGGGGVSRKIVDPVERRELKQMLATMEIPDTISLIIRTAGMGRTKREIARDLQYLLRLWKTIEEKAASSKAPALIHEEGELIIRTIRDLYTSDMEEILIEGADAYRRGKDFMRVLMPRFVKVVQPYKDRIPLFHRFQVESQIESMHDRTVPLKAGGYLVIDTTEALVSIDINSGRSTREMNIEATAFKTNLQAVDEIARQLRLRDLGGLVVVDFIDMEDKKHVHEIEKRFRDALKLDRAKITLGKISQFGLLEFSRQRLKPNFTESSADVCPQCQGHGTVRSVESMAVALLRHLEERASTELYSRIQFEVPTDVAQYLLNVKRRQLAQMEQESGVEIQIVSDVNLRRPHFNKAFFDRETGNQLPAGHERKTAVRPPPPPVVEKLSPDEDDVGDDDLDMPVSSAVPAAADADTATLECATVTTEGATAASPAAVVTAEGGERKRRRRRRRRRGERDTTSTAAASSGDDFLPDDQDENPLQDASDIPGPGASPGADTATDGDDGGEGTDDDQEGGDSEDEQDATTGEGAASEANSDQPRRRRRRRRRRSARRPGTPETADTTATPDTVPNPHGDNSPQQEMSSAMAEGLDSVGPASDVAPQATMATQEADAPVEAVETPAEASEMAALPAEDGGESGTT